jgi:hypothetical protein
MVVPSWSAPSFAEAVHGPESLNSPGNLAAVLSRAGDSGLWQSLNCPILAQQMQGAGGIPKERPMPMRSMQRAGKIKYGLAAWLLGLPLPIVILALFFRGCDW